MPKHNFVTLTCVSKTVHIITTTLYIQVNYTVFFQDKLGFHLVVNARAVRHPPSRKTGMKICGPMEKSPVP
ncbi:unnamed protein product [Staurois parvus]|uniref:Uncharacterized protein n=1 Tax=Staurois parvus TaxID=386267 RepID=A0ABN9EUN8_9NEOB|nr:unnamed protein product [Staurois parvus]